MILDRHYTPGDGQAEVEICGMPYHGLMQLETFSGIALNGGAGIVHGVAYTVGITASTPDGVNRLVTCALDGGPYTPGVDYTVDVTAGTVIIHASGGILAGATLATSHSAYMIALPNGHKKSSYMPTGGNTYRQQVPGIGAVSRTTEQAASDTANGYQWLDYLVLSGINQQIYNNFALGTNGWIYCAGDGRRWHVRLVNPASVSGNSATFEFLINPFGDYPASGTAITQYVSVSDLGQASPAITFSTWSFATGTNSCTVNSLRIDLDDIKPDGSAAVFGLRSLCPQSVLMTEQPAWALGEPASMGFLLVSITDGSSGPVIAISVLHNRAATIGTYTQESDGETLFSDRILGVWFNASGSPLPVTLTRHQDSNRVTNSYTCPGSASASTTGDHTWRLTWDAQVAEFIMSCAASTTASCTLVDAGDAGFVPVGHITGAGSYDLAGAIIGSVTLDNDNYSLSASAEVWSFTQSFWGNSLNAFSSHPQAYSGAAKIELRAGSLGDISSGESAILAIKRLSNKYFGLLAMRCDNTAPILYGNGIDVPWVWQDTEDMIWIGGFTPAGQDSHDGDLGIQPLYVPSGTTHPLTHIPHLQPNGSLVCFV